MKFPEETPSNTPDPLARGESFRRLHGDNGPENGKHSVSAVGASSHASNRATAAIKVVPPSVRVRDQIRAAAARHAATLEQSRPFSMEELQTVGRLLLQQLKLKDEYLGFAMVWLGNAFWRQRFLATPFHRRLLLLPENVQHIEDCDSLLHVTDTDIGECAACAISAYRNMAEDLGYTVLMTASATAVLKTILEGQLEGIIGIANLDELEKANEKVLVVRIPSYAIPLNQSQSGACLDDDTVRAVLDICESAPASDSGAFVSLVQAANQLFADDFELLLPRVRSQTQRASRTPLNITETIAYDWLQHGGKRFRPFITLAAYDALTGAQTSPVSASGQEKTTRFPEDVCRVAMAIEAFHKASLAHDDIQDDDQFRYGRKTLHRAHGIGPAINIGDYLIGLGYRLVNACRGTRGADVAADIVNSMADAHIKLCDGQGAEMAWQESPDWSMLPEDALQIYALKTSPAFEAALFAGLRLAGPIDTYADMIPPFAQHLGIGFQVLNDLKDWKGDADNKLIAGQDALAIRPTVLLALALEEATEPQRDELREIYEMTGDEGVRLSKLQELFVELGAFRRAEGIVDDARERASTLADSVRPVALRRLLQFLIDTVLAGEPSQTPFSADIALVEPLTASR